MSAPAPRPRRRPRAARMAPALLLLLTAAPGRAFDVLECDGFDTPGDAAIIQGWAEPTDAAIGQVVIDDQGSVNSGIPAGSVLPFVWSQQIADWAGTPSQDFAFPPGTTRSVTGAELGVSLSGGSENLFVVIQPSTSIPAGSGEFVTTATGWTEITGTGDATLGLTFLQLDTVDRHVLDADIVLNDDNSLGAANFSLTTQPGLYHLPSVMAHEFGHFLGIDHSDVAGALMAPGLTLATNVPIGVDDRRAFQFLYPATGFVPEDPSRNLLAFSSCEETLEQLVNEALSAEPEGGCRAGPPTRTRDLPGVVLIWAIALAIVGSRVARTR